MTKPHAVRVAGVWRIAMYAKHEAQRFESVQWCIERNRAAGVHRLDAKIVIHPDTLPLFRLATEDPAAFWA